MTEEWIATREPVTLKVSGGEEHTFPPGTMFKLQRVYGGGDPAITAPGGIEIKEPENNQYARRLHGRRSWPHGRRSWPIHGGRW